MEKPLYIKSFSRDFTLAIMEIWSQAEALDNKIWTKEKQPYMPYMIFERSEGMINSYYDPRGIKWIKTLLKENIKNNDGFINYIEENLTDSIRKLKDLYSDEPELSHDDLVYLLKEYRKSWIWFEAAWWIWDMDLNELEGLKISSSFKDGRKYTEDFVPKGEATIRKSIVKLFPNHKKYLEVIRVGEIIDNTLPDIKVLKQRLQSYFLVGKDLYVNVGKKEIEEKYYVEFEKIKIENDVKEFKGQTAYSGLAKSRARIILSNKNLDKMDEGDILVSSMTLPDFLPAIKKAAAIVTDEGGLLCHAAIVSRELKKPCIIGTKIATKVLKDGDLVEVDAVRGVVKIINN